MTKYKTMKFCLSSCKKYKKFFNFGFKNLHAQYKKIYLNLNPVKYLDFGLYLQ